MSFRRSVLASYVSQIYVAGIGLVMVPLYLRYLGAEAYGLVGVFTMMQAWFQLLDLGLSPTFSREVARFRAGVVSAKQLRVLFKILEIFFFSTALTLGVAIFCFSGAIATDWLRPGSLSQGEVQNAVILMGLAAPMRWVSGLYRGAINGFERQATLATVNAAIATARFVGVLAALSVLGSTPRVFFGYQLAVAAVEVFSLGVVAYNLLPCAKVSIGRSDLVEVRSVLKFSLSISITGAIWVMLTQVDKLVLTKLLTLTEYGYVSLAVALAGGVNIVTAPLSQVLMPRLARMAAEGEDSAMRALYQRSATAIAIVGSTVGGVLAFSAEHVLFAWTGSHEAASNAREPLFWYALGNGVLGVASFPYYWQYAKGSVKLHIVGNIILIACLIPAVWILTEFYGKAGGAIGWFSAILMYFALWVTYSHIRLLGLGAAREWALSKVIPWAITPAFVIYIFGRLLPSPEDRMLQGAVPAAIGASSMLLMFGWRRFCSRAIP